MCHSVTKTNMMLKILVEITCERSIYGKGIALHYFQGINFHGKRQDLQDLWGEISDQ